MDSANSSVDNSHGSLPFISESGGPLQLDSHQHNEDDRKPRRRSQGAYLKRIPPPLHIPHAETGRRPSEFPTGSPKKSISSGSSRKFSDSFFPKKHRDSYASPSVQFTPGPFSATSRHNGPDYSGGQSPNVRRGSEMPGRYARRQSEMPGRKGSVVPTGWDIHGRRDSHQSWPSNNRRFTQMQKSSFLSQLLKARYRDDFSGSLTSSDHYVGPRFKMENTYKTEPDRKFEANAVEKIIK